MMRVKNITDRGISSINRGNPQYVRVIVNLSHSRRET